MSAPKWSEVIESVERQWQEFKAGKDFDPQSSELYVKQLRRTMETLEAFYRTNPQGDDRPHAYLSHPKIGLDIDEVLGDWVGAWKKKHKIKKDVHCWNFDHEMVKRFEEMKDDKDFWLGIPALIKPENLPFEPHAYITARSIPIEWSKEWLFQVVGYPVAPVYSVGFGVSKIDAATAAGIEVFVDDSFKNFCELNKAGILTYLWDAPHNRKYEVGYKRINDLKILV